MEDSTVWVCESCDWIGQDPTYLVHAGLEQKEYPNNPVCPTCAAFVVAMQQVHAHYARYEKLVNRIKDYVKKQKVQKFDIQTVKQLVADTPAHSQIKEIVLSWCVGEDFFNSLKQDPVLNYWEYTTVWGPKTKYEAWKPIFRRYKEHLDEHAEEKDFEFGYVCGIPVRFSDDVPICEYKVVYKEK